MKVQRRTNVARRMSTVSDMIVMPISHVLSQHIIFQSSHRK